MDENTRPYPNPYPNNPLGAPQMGPGNSAREADCCKVAREPIAREVARELAHMYSKRAHEFDRLAESLGELPHPADAALRRTLRQHMQALHELG